MKKEVHINKKGLFIIGLFVTIIFIISIYVCFSGIDKLIKEQDSMNEISNQLNELNIQQDIETNLASLWWDVIINLIVQIFSYIAIIYVLYVISCNRANIQDITECLNATEITDKAINKLKHKDIKMNSAEFTEVLNKSIYFCQNCGCTIYEEDTECPSCGRKINFKK